MTWWLCVTGAAGHVLWDECPVWGQCPSGPQHAGSTAPGQGRCWPQGTQETVAGETRAEGQMQLLSLVISSDSCLFLRLDHPSLPFPSIPYPSLPFPSHPRYLCRSTHAMSTPLACFIWHYCLFVCVSCYSSTQPTVCYNCRCDSQCGVKIISSGSRL